MLSSNPLHPALFAGSLGLALALSLSSATFATSASAAPAAAADAKPAESAAGPTKRVLPSPTEAMNSCATCHATLADTKLRVPASECAGSAHRDPRLSCVGCHRGDSRDPTVGAHAKALGFLPHPTQSEVPVLCGSCHSDASLMRRMNGRLQIGQADLYNLSLHGRLSAAGDVNAPTCASCHGAHGIISPTSPLAPVNRLNVAKLCGGCHADREKMAKYEVRTDQFEKWQHSVHGQAFAKGNANAPTCTGCHGAHASAPPDSSSVAHSCGRCHENEMQLFERSAHSPAFRSRGIAQCVACHGNHDIAPATPILVGTSADSSCMKCHEKDQKMREVAENISDILSGARQRATGARDAVTSARERGLSVTGATFSLDQLSTAEQKVRALVHTLDPARVKAGVAEIDREVDETKRLVAEAEHERQLERRDFYIALAIAAILLAALVLKARQLDKRGRSGGSA